MEQSFKEGRWYRLTLPLGKEYIAQYLIEHGGGRGEYFLFPDQSRTAAGDLVPFLNKAEEIDPPEKNARYDISDFL